MSGRYSNPSPVNYVNLAILGFLLFMVAWGLSGVAWQKVRPSSQDKATMNNLRALHAESGKFFREHPGVDSVSLTSLIGTNSTQYIHNWMTVAQETYPSVIMRGQRDLTATGLAGTRTITFGP